MKSTDGRGGRDAHFENGKVVLPERWDQLLDWLVDPSREGTQKECAERLGYTPQHIPHIKRDPLFRAAMEKRLDELNIRPDRVQEVVESLFKQAKQGSTKAAELYLRYVEKLAPPKVVVEDHRASEMSQDELLAALEAAKQEVGTAKLRAL